MSPTYIPAALRIEDGYVVLGVPRCVEYLERAARAERHGIAFVQRMDAVFVDRDHGTPHRFELLGAVDTGRGVPQASRASQMRGADVMHSNAGIGKALGEVAGGTTVVNVNVGDKDGGQGVDAEVVEHRQQVLEACCRPGVDQQRFRGVVQIARQPVRQALHSGVDQVEAIGELGDVDTWVRCHTRIVPSQTSRTSLSKELECRPNHPKQNRPRRVGRQPLPPQRQTNRRIHKGALLTGTTSRSWAGWPSLPMFAYSLQERPMRVYW